MTHDWPKFVQQELEAEDTEFNPVSARVTLVSEDGETTVDALVERLPGFKGDRAYFPLDEAGVDQQEMYVHEDQGTFEASSKANGGYVAEELDTQFEILAAGAEDSA